MEVAEALFVHLYCRHGAVKHIVSDQGKEFVNRINEAVNHLLEQQAIFTTPYNPNANGFAENQNRTIKDMLSSYVNEQQTNWAKFLPIMAHAYRTTVNSVTGFTPFFANHGREARQPSDQWMDEFVKLNFTNGTTLDDYVHRLQKAMVNCWDAASQRRIDKHNRADEARLHKNTRHPRKPTNHKPTDHPKEPGEDYHPDEETIRHLLRRFVQYKPNDTFYVRKIPKREFKDPKDEELHKINAKLQDRYSGPHQVIEQMNPVQYKCLINGKEKLVHVNKMKKDMAQGDRNLTIMHQDEQESIENYYDDDQLFEDNDQQQDIDNMEVILDVNQPMDGQQDANNEEKVEAYG